MFEMSNWSQMPVRQMLGCGKRSLSFYVQKLIRSTIGSANGMGTFANSNSFKTFNESEMLLH